VYATRTSRAEHRRHGGDPALDVLVDRRRQLRPVGQVHLDPVVGRRVVAGRDHDARVGAEVQHGEGEHRGRQVARQQQRPHARTGQHGARVGLERHRAVPGVPADHDGDLAGRTGQQVRGQPGGGAPDHGAVHPVRAASHRPAQPGGPEVQRPGEAVLQRRLVACVEQALQLGAGDRVRVVGDPGPHVVMQRPGRGERP
jgi:hypothetical protein